MHQSLARESYSPLHTLHTAQLYIELELHAAYTHNYLTYVHAGTYFSVSLSLVNRVPLLSWGVHDALNDSLIIFPWIIITVIKGLVSTWRTMMPLLGPKSFLIATPLSPGSFVNCGVTEKYGSAIHSTLGVETVQMNTAVSSKQVIDALKFLTRIAEPTKQISGWSRIQVGGPWWWLAIEIQTTPTVILIGVGLACKTDSG